MSERRRVDSTSPRSLARPEFWLPVGLALAIAVGFTWGLPGGDSWAADSISPRSCGLGAIVETYRAGHFHTYPPLHMALLTLLSAPWIGLAAGHVGLEPAALLEELVQPSYMTPIEVEARLVTGAMAVAILYQTMRLWTRIAGRNVGVGAGVVVGTNATFLYYAHTGNLDVPYLFWTTWAYVEMDRVMCGEPRERQAFLLSTAAVLTKDQAAAALLLPLAFSLAYVPQATRGLPPTRRSLVHGIGLAASVYAVVSGALVNPTGFRRRWAFLLGPASQSWAGYPHTFHGTLSLARDSVAAIPHFTSWPIALAAVAGAAHALVSARGIERARHLAPLLGAISFSLFFSLSARRSDDRFLLPQSLALLPYAAVAFDRAWKAWPRARAVLALGCAAAIAPALLGAASMDATLVADPRYAAERFLATLPPRARVEVYGGPHFLPRIPPSLVAVRPGVEPIEDRQRIAGITDLVDPYLDPRPRFPAAIVLATELSDAEASEPPSAAQPFGLMAYRDEKSRAFLRALANGSLGYSRTLRAICTLPWPLACRRVHGSTAGEVWIYQPDRTASSVRVLVPRLGTTARAARRPARPYPEPSERRHRQTPCQDEQRESPGHRAIAERN